MQIEKSLLEQSVSFFLSAFRFPGLDWKPILVAVSLGLLFGLIWLLAYRPPLKRSRLFITVGVVSAFLTWAAIAFIQIPLQIWSGQLLLQFWSQTTLSRWLLAAGIPAILLSGLVQEGAKLVPVAMCWIANQRNLDVRTGLLVGAVSGVGFGIFEAVWVHNTMFASGWTWQVVQSNGIISLVGFWERFFTVGFHIAAGALAGYGLARGAGWQFYLISAFLHGALNYAVVLLQTGLLSVIELEIYVGVFSLVLTAFVLYLRWRKPPGSMLEGLFYF
jgi:RsiW-degrading membrane proteinase PrsW (M82 family)